MRTEYQTELDQLVTKLDAMAGLVQQALDAATTALPRAARTVADSVLAAADQADAAQRDIDQHPVSLIARQQPVASDLRAIIAYLLDVLDALDDEMDALRRQLYPLIGRHYERNADHAVSVAR